MSIRSQFFPARKSSVRQDWRAWLPSEKAAVFSEHALRLESSYQMFSVALNDALEFRRTGKLAKACQAVGVLAPLCCRLTRPLEALLRSLGEHARHYGTVPNTAPLDPLNFRGSREQRAAKMSDLLSRVLLTQRSLFLHKISTLEEMVIDVAKTFSEAAEDLELGASVSPSNDWLLIDAAHYDLNTCLREAFILLKSFLLVLPTDQLDLFQKIVASRMNQSISSPGTTRHRRMIPIEGE